MPSYDYLAIDAGGRERSGALTAAGEMAVRDLLSARGLIPVRINAATRAAPSAAGPALFEKKLSAKQLTLFTRQLSTLITVTPLEEALRSISGQADKPHIRRIIGNVHAGVVEGKRLGAALGDEPGSFPPLYRAMVAAGEGSGAMTEILDRLAALMERQAEVRSKIVTALVYPVMLALVALLIVTGLMVFVIPRVVEQFDNMGQQLPMLTRITIGTSDAMTTYGPYALIAFFLAGAALIYRLRDERFRLRFDRWLLTWPLIGRLIREVNAARLARTLSTVVANGMPLLDGLTVTARTVPNRAVRAACLSMVEAVNEGGSLSGAMRRTALFPPLLVHMATSGEQSGQLDEMLARAADYMEREFDAFTTGALSLLEPAIIVVMGGMVAVIVLSILLPIMQLNTLAIS
ncbi:type II secretion system inner membrane protein GspF [Pacificimonas sp. WHA3]|uniref:General secretion pathway protein F n=1 Tax=Pacificimonas pallii TaxID=2827236 RepID=A0ABS6SHJ6_9SPHN|nr:type II secretion system inner membrane protein GspF [Pacificimonas pallii]MBV7257811.1 type II secretion system inner membrane protein GspF [Pacificimonas pallii]